MFLLLSLAISRTGFLFFLRKMRTILSSSTFDVSRIGNDPDGMDSDSMPLSTTKTGGNFCLSNSN